MRSFRVSYCRIQIWCNMKQLRRKGSGETCCYLCCDCLCRGGIYCYHLNSHCHGCDNHQYHHHHHSHYHYHQTRSLSYALFRLQKITKTEWEKIRQPTPNKKFLNFVSFELWTVTWGGGMLRILLELGSNVTIILQLCLSQKALFFNPDHLKSIALQCILIYSIHLEVSANSVFNFDNGI